MLTLQAYRLALDAIIRDFVAKLGTIISVTYSPLEREHSIDAMAALITEEVRHFRGRAHARGEIFLRAEASRQGVEDPYVPDLSDYSEESVRITLRKHLRGTPNEARVILARMFSQHVESAARQVVTRAVEDGVVATDPADEEHMERTRLSPEEFAELTGEPAPTDDEDIEDDDGLDEFINADEPSDDEPPRETSRGVQPKSWARVLTGAEHCGFCVMLASRGPIYTSAQAAGQGRASDVHGPDAKGDVNTYHPGCDCMVVPVYNYNTWAGKEYHRALEDFYYSTIGQSWSGSYNAPHLREKWAGTGRRGIAYATGPTGGGSTNEVVNALDRSLRRLKAEGRSLPIPDIRSGA